MTKLLRFLTGSDIIIIENTEVSFCAMQGLARRPITHTCAPVLELPNSYRNFCELREEFTSILIECWKYGNQFHVKIVEVGLKLKREGNHLFLASTCADIIILSICNFFFIQTYIAFFFFDVANLFLNSLSI